MINLIKLIIFSLVLYPSFAFAACPKVDGLVDFNCDGKIKLVFLGDSVVYGVGDAYNKGRGGYVYYASELIPEASFVRMGYKGIETSQLLRNVKKYLNSGSSNSYKKNLKDADMVFIDVGRNDYWRKQSAATSVNNIKRTVSALKTFYKNNRYTEPHIVVTTLIPTARTYQASFVNSVNTLLRKQKSSAMPVYFRFDGLRISILSKDGVHPDSDGYYKMATRIGSYIFGSLQKQMAVLEARRK